MRALALVGIFGQILIGICFVLHELGWLHVR